MRIGVIPDGTREWLMLRSPRFPLPLFDVMGTMLLSRAVMAGVHLGVFDHLEEKTRSAAELAQATGCDPHGVELLLDALVACGYLERENGGYRNSRLSRQWLLSRAPQTLANFVRYNYDQWEWTSHLEDYLQRGEARDIHDTLDAPRWRNYMLGLRDIAALSADELAARLRFPAPPRRLLDIGGGHCLYSIVLCRRYPGLRATIVDLEPAARVGRELVTEAGLADRFEFRHGRVTETDLGQNHDAALLFNVVHHLDEETNRKAFQQIQKALTPRGMLVVWEAFREERERQRRDQLGSLLGLFFGIISRRQTYEFSQVAAWAREAGFREIRRQKLRSAPFASLLIAAK